MTRNLLLILSLFISLANTAQNPVYRVVSIPVIRNGISVREPWTGGMDAPQFSPIDLNRDGITDLFVFDRVGNKVLTYLSNGDGTDTMYSYAPKYEELFPADLINWALIRDYNHDGIPDIFTYTTSSSGPGVRVFKGSIVMGELHFNLVCPLLKAINAFSSNAIYVNVGDIPAITDVNRDGDMDILAYDIAGGQIGYYENQTREHPGDPVYDVDSLKYVEVTSCWGNVSQSQSSNSMLLNISCKGNGETGQQHGNTRHLGNSLYDINDPVYHTTDLLNGNIGYNNLLLLRNCGDTTSANVCEWDSIYPACDVPMLMPEYPAAFGVDANNDGKADLLMSPNITTTCRNVKNVMYYKGTGDTSCWYNYQNDSFIVHHTLDLGSDSKPLFYDFDGDGLTDIVSGNYGYFRPYAPYLSTLAFYKNTGTATHPAFTEISTDNELISNFHLVAFNPAFGDMDGDGHNDMIAGDLYGYLYYFRNAATTGSSFPVMTTSQYFGINVGFYAAPFIYDVNGDSLNDIIVGKQNGKISYYWNFGTRTTPMFSTDSVNDNFGNINVSLSGPNFGYSQPRIYKDNSGNNMLYVGSYSGAVFVYQIDSSKLRNGTFNTVSTDLLKHETGTESTISVADINNDGHLEYLVGTSRGGFLMYSDSLWDTSTVLSINTPEPGYNGFRIYPNPANGYFTCDFGNAELTNPVISVIDLLGKQADVPFIKNDHQVIVQTNELSNGFYIVRINNAGKFFTGKILIER